MNQYKLTPLLLLLVLIIGCKKDDVQDDEVDINGIVWKTKNLNVNHYRNGDKIQYASNQAEWEQYGKDGIGAYCYPSNQSSKDEKYGKLYNWYAVNDERGLAPDGWEIPDVADFEALEDAAGGSDIAAMNLKATHTWEVSGLASKGKDKLDWEGMPSGERTGTGDFVNGGDIRGLWWTSQEWNVETDCATTTCPETLLDKRAWCFGLHYEWDWSYLSYRTKMAGFSVRCIKERREH